MTIINFTPISGFVGGLFIGVSATLLLWLNGEIAGISGIFDGALRRPGKASTRDWLFLIGLVGGAAIEFWLVPGHRAFHAVLHWPVFLLAGLLVGYGTAMGCGCTSGHGVCGLGRLSMRSLIATLTFMATGTLTVFILRHLFGVF
ncbi:MAG: YeeE/YedE family protein [Gammaproteobacteria bacterium]